MGSSSKWTTKNIPNLTGRTALVTGANSGLGFETSLALAAKGAHVVMACRSSEKGTVAARQIRRLAPTASVEVLPLNLASLASIRQGAADFRKQHQNLHLLINNAGVMATPYRQTADGFELQFGTNHLGHFVLTGELLELLLPTPNARVVTISSGMHTFGEIDFANLNGERSYNPWRAYSQSKLANLLFAYELQRRLAASGSAVISIAAHPGYAATNLQVAGPALGGSQAQIRLMALGNRLVAQSASMGALPTLYAATAPDVRGGDYFGPRGIAGSRGHPKKTHSTKMSHDGALAARLWAVSEELTGVHYALEPASVHTTADHRPA
jgi:hypothetical protein